MNEKFSLTDKVTIRVIKKQNKDQKKINNSSLQNKDVNKEESI